MPQAGVFALGAASFAATALLPLRRSFVALVLVVVLIPSTLAIPNGFSSYLTITNVAVWGAAAGLIGRSRRGELAPDAFRATPVQAALAVLIAVGVLNGFAFAGPATDASAAMQWIVAFATQLALITMALAYIRTIDDPGFVVGVLAATLVLSSGIAITERLVGTAWGQFLFSHRRVFTLAAFDLRGGGRGGKVRVRAGAEFPLEFAWMSVMLLPALLARVGLPPHSRPRRSPLIAVALAGALLAIYWSLSRSAAAFLPVAGLVLWAASGFHRRIGRAIAIAAAVIAVLLLASPGLRRPVVPQSDPGSVRIRNERRAQLTEFVARRPVTGLGIQGPQREAGVRASDVSLLQVYGELGVPGVAALATALLVALLASARGLRGPPSPIRTLAAVGFTGAVGGVVGAFALDLFSVQGSALVFWLVVSAGVVAGEQMAGPLPLVARPLSRGRMSMPLAGATLGVAVLALAPSFGVVTSRVLVVSPAKDAASQSTAEHAETVLGRTTCDLVRSVAASQPGVLTRCRDLGLEAGEVGVIELRVQASTPRGARAAADSLFERLRRSVPTLQRLTVGITGRRRSTVALTAPLWLAWLGAGTALWLPRPGQRRRVLSMRPSDPRLSLSV